MNVEQIRTVAQRSPFRPFTLRLSNGARYDFKEPKNFGAPDDLHVICYFGARDMVLIDPIHIVEVLDSTAPRD
jgi:hypothetical protein